MAGCGLQGVSLSTAWDGNRMQGGARGVLLPPAACWGSAAVLHASSARMAGSCLSVLTVLLAYQCAHHLFPGKAMRMSPVTAVLNGCSTRHRGCMTAGTFVR